MPKPQTLFDLVVASSEVHPSFEAIRTQSASHPARWMMDRVFEHFVDSDGNFVQQLQSAGFDARIFELYLSAYFYYSGFDIERPTPAPDFIVSLNGKRVAVEATTVNPPTAGVLAKLGKQISDLSHEELSEYQRHELPLRFGSPLFSKLNKRYWELPDVQGLPFVLAIEAFHDDDSLGLGDSALAGYLYGISHNSSWDDAGALSIEFDRIYSHVIGPKTVPSSFFEQPDTEHVSAVLFTNAGTYAKFNRMAYQAGVGGDTIEMRRVGYCSNLDKDVRDPTYFTYDVGNPPIVEWWGQGLVVLHNPRAKHPLEMDFFPDAVHTFFEEGRVRDMIPDWHVFSSKTVTFDLGEIKARLREVLPPEIPRCAVGGITKEEFYNWTGFEPPESYSEDGWFCDEAIGFLGVVLRDNRDGKFGFSIWARDEFFDFFECESRTQLRTRFEAVRTLQQRIARLLTTPQRVFPR